MVNATEGKSREQGIKITRAASRSVASAATNHPLLLYFCLTEEPPPPLTHSLRHREAIKVSHSLQPCCSQSGEKDKRKMLQNLTAQSRKESVAVQRGNTLPQDTRHHHPTPCCLHVVCLIGFRTSTLFASPVFILWPTKKPKRTFLLHPALWQESFTVLQKLVGCETAPGGSTL